MKTMVFVHSGGPLVPSVAEFVEGLQQLKELMRRQLKLCYGLRDKNVFKEWIGRL